MEVQGVLVLHTDYETFKTEMNFGILNSGGFGEALILSESGCNCRANKQSFSVYYSG